MHVWKLYVGIFGRWNGIFVVGVSVGNEYLRSSRIKLHSCVKKNGRSRGKNKSMLKYMCRELLDTNSWEPVGNLVVKNLELFAEEVEFTKRNKSKLELELVGHVEFLDGK